MNGKDIKKQSTNTLESYLRDGNVSFYGYEGKNLPNFISENKKGRARFFIKTGRASRIQQGGVPVFHYGSLSEVREQNSDVYFLDNEAVKVLFAEFPGSAQYVLIRLVPRLSWIVAFPGFIRRLSIGLIKVERIITLPAGGSAERWLVVRHMLAQSLNTRLSLSSEIGVLDFLDYLRREKLKYVVLRFYDKLPDLYREGGDLDILVADEDDHKVREFLQAHPGTIGIDVWTPSRSSHNSITYYPPPLARKIIESAIDGPAGSFIPSPKEAFLSLAYHAVYHKGFFAGVPSCLPGAEVNVHPENDYAGVLARMAKDLGIDVDITMESLDNYLSQEGWQPKLDTLAKIAPRNKWVWDRFFSTEPTKEIGLGVFIIKQKAFSDGVADAMVKTIAEHDGFKITHTKKFSESEVKYVADHLRGGVWNDISGAIRDYLPAMAIITFDTTLARSSKMNIMHDNPDKRIRSLKKILRNKHDTGKISLVHATDNTKEALEYIEWCFPQEADDIKKEAERMYEEIKVYWLERMKLSIVLIPRFIMYRFTVWKQGARGYIVQWLLK